MRPGLPASYCIYLLHDSGQYLAGIDPPSLVVELLVQP